MKNTDKNTKKKDYSTRCWFCGNKMIWNSDFDFKDYGINGDGIVATLTCSNPNCNATAEFYTKINE